MAQSNAAQREPSMEEILASIRRIIEDSDTQHDTANDDRPPEIGADADIDADDDAEAGKFRAELQAPRAGIVARDDPPFSTTRPTAAVTPLRGTLDAASATPPSVTVRQIEAAPASRPVPPAVAVAARAEPARPGLSRAEAVTPMPKPAISPQAVASASATPAHSPVAQSSVATRGAIMSAGAGRQVAASFGELSDAFAASRRRSFDEVAEEMMRPLLQEWMDNNLPRLVERLVREEIERIARGGSGGGSD